MSFESVFLKLDAVKSNSRYEAFVAGSKKVWDLYSSKYDVCPKSLNRAKMAQEYTVYLKIEGKRYIGFCIGVSTTTLYIYNHDLREKVDFELEVSPQKEYRHTFSDINDCLAAVDKFL